MKLLKAVRGIMFVIAGMFLARLIPKELVAKLLARAGLAVLEGRLPKPLRDALKAGFNELGNTKTAVGSSAGAAKFLATKYSKVLDPITGEAKDQAEQAARQVDLMAEESAASAKSASESLESAVDKAQDASESLEAAANETTDARSALDAVAGKPDDAKEALKAVADQASTDDSSRTDKGSRQKSTRKSAKATSAQLKTSGQKTGKKKTDGKKSSSGTHKRSSGSTRKSAKKAQTKPKDESSS